MNNNEIGLTLTAIRVSFMEAVKNCSDEEKGVFLKMIEALEIAENHFLAGELWDAEFGGDEE